MSPFVIFLIVLTIGYALYYAAMITIDLTAKPKDDEAKEETLDTSDMDDGTGYTPKTVTESSDGGFNIHDYEPEHQKPEETDGDIAEAEEEEAEQELQESEQENEPAPDAATESDSEPKPEQAEQSEATEPEPEESQPAEEAEGDGGEEEIEGISTVQFVEDAPVTVREEVDKSDVPAFNPNLNTPTYGVSEVFGTPRKDSSVLRKASVVSSSLSSIETKGNQYDSFNLRNILAVEEQAQQEHIEVHNEATRM